MTKTSNNCIKILIVLSTTGYNYSKINFLFSASRNYFFNYNNQYNINSQFECINIHIYIYKSNCTLIDIHHFYFHSIFNEALSSLSLCLSFSFRKLEREMKRRGGG